MLGVGRVVVVVISVVVVVVIGGAVVGGVASVVLTAASAVSASVWAAVSTGDTVVAGACVVGITCSTPLALSAEVVGEASFDLIVEISRTPVAEFPGPPSLLQLTKAMEVTAATARNDQILQRPREGLAGRRGSSERLPPPRGML